MRFAIVAFAFCRLVWSATAADQYSEFYQISASPDSTLALGIAYETGHPPKVFEREGGFKDVRIGDGEDAERVVRHQKVAVVALPSKRLIQEFDNRGAISGSWSSDSKHLAIRWSVYRTDGGGDMWRLIRKSGQHSFVRESIPEKLLTSTIRRDPEFHSGLTWFFRPVEWRGRTLHFECIPAQTRKESSHPFAQDETWYEVALKLKNAGLWTAVELKATHGNYHTDGTEIRRNPIWRSDE